MQNIYVDVAGHLRRSHQITQRHIENVLVANVENAVLGKETGAEIANVAAAKYRTIDKIGSSAFRVGSGSGWKAERAGLEG